MPTFSFLGSLMRLAFMIAAGVVLWAFAIFQKVSPCFTVYFAALRAGGAMVLRTDEDGAIAVAGTAKEVLVARD